MKSTRNMSGTSCPQAHDLSCALLQGKPNAIEQHVEASVHARAVDGNANRLLLAAHMVAVGGQPPAVPALKEKYRRCMLEPPAPQFRISVIPSLLTPAIMC